MVDTYVNHQEDAMHGLRKAPAAPHPSAAGPRRRWSVLVLLCAAQFMVILDATVVNVALPSIARSLHFAPADLQWVVTAYVLLSGGLMLLGGRAADVAGGRRVFLAGLAVFTAASLSSGLAPSAGALIAARAGQGLGAAMLTPAALAIITATYEGAQRAAALSTWGALGGAGAAAGVLAGGVLTTWLGWRSVFLVNVPVGVAVFALAPHLVPPGARGASARRGLDLPGAVLAVAGLVALVYAFTQAQARGWGSLRTVLTLTVSAVLLAAFILTERTVANPLVPPRTWRSRSLTGGTAVMSGATALLVGTFFLNTLYLQDLLGASPLRTGLEFLPLVAVTGLGAHLVSHLLPKAGTRVLVIAGLILMGGGALLMSAGHGGYLAGVLPGLLLTGAGTGLVFPAASVTAMSEVEHGQAPPSITAGLASGLLTTSHDVGAALGVALFSVIASVQVTGVAGYRHGFAVAAGIAAGLALLAVFTVPAVRPAPGTRVAVH
jgi:EmrB/QacA subfamily drug resistance transporter